MEAAQERRNRMKALREEAGEDAGPSTSKPGAPAAEPVLKFRNYTVRDDKIEHKVIAPAQAPEFEAPKPDANARQRPEEVLASLAPKKANADLRRDVEKQLAKLERRTQRALVQIAQAQEAQS